MKTLFALPLAAAFALGTIASVSAQSTTTTTPPAAEKKTDEKMDKKMKHMPSKSASGTVKSATADSIVVAGKEKGKEAEWTFGVDSGTKIRKSGKAVTAADLKPGDNVSVKYHEMDGKTMAQSIAVRGGGMAKKSTATTDKPATEKK